MFAGRRDNNIFSLCSVIVLLLFSQLAQGEWYAEQQDIMGTRITVELWADSERQGREAIEKVMTEMRRIDVAMNPWDKNSELYRVNAEAARSPLAITAELYQLIDRALYYSRLSEGAFDISFASVAQYYDYRRRQSPTAEQFSEHHKSINYKNIRLDAAKHSIFFVDKNIAIDLGGIAKGHAVDRGIDILQRQGIRSAIITAGGDSRVLGDRAGRPWVIGIRHPRAGDKQVVRIPLENTAISTSGDYERFFIRDGERHHHILNPASGRSAQAVQSVSILAPLSLDSDALSTAVFVLGVKRGLALVNRLPGIDAIIVDAEGLLHYSDELLMPK